MLDTSVPNVARMYDYMLGGRENFQADRDAVDSMLRVTPEVRETVRDNRAFLRRAVRYLADQGIAQFLDVGSGLPTQDNVHEIARETRPAARVAYVDHDPLVVSHGNALLAKSEQVIVVQADLRQAKALVGLPAICDHLDFSAPVAVILLQVLHFVSGGDDPGAIVAAFKDALCPGSYLVIGHVTADHVPGHLMTKAVATYSQASDSLWPRTRSQILDLFSGFELVDPGLTPEYAWRAEPGEVSDGRKVVATLVGVARKP
jgi:SAM-dependent methyltransferase